MHFASKAHFHFSQKTSNSAAACTTALCGEKEEKLPMTRGVGSSAPQSSAGEALQALFGKRGRGLCWLGEGLPSLSQRARCLPATLPSLI